MSLPSVLILHFVEILEAPSAVQALKSIKNSVEIQGFRNAHIRDAVAKIQFLCWIENEVRKGNESLNEFNAAKKLGEFRRYI